MSKFKFNAEIKGSEKWPGAGYVDIPNHIIEAFGNKGRIPIMSTIDGVAYQGSLVKMGMPCHMLLILKGIREQIGKTHGEMVSIEIEEDKSIRKVTVSKELKALFKKEKEAQDFFKKLSYTNQKEYVLWIESAKREETKQRRLSKTIKMLNQKIKHP